MAHSHENCTRPSGGSVCTDGRVYASCGHELCNSDDCEYQGHCACRCHDGKTCACGLHVWPRQERKTRA